MEQSCHVAVLEREVVEFLRAESGGNFLDCTLGGAGHTRAILEAHPKNYVTAIDRDMRAIQRAEKSLSKYNERCRFFQCDFAGLSKELSGCKFDAILADLGISSDQLAEGRGFSFTDQSALDMRMDESEGQSAAEILNAASERELVRMLKEGGAEQEATFAAAAIIKHRPFQSAQKLASCINQALPARFHAKKTQPATVVFQAIRIAVNDELRQIERLLEQAPKLANPAARLAVIAFHSTEDKLVTRTMRKWASSDFSATSPSFSTHEKLGQLLTKKAVMASPAELEQNPRARSAALRVFQFN